MEEFIQQEIIKLKAQLKTYEVLLDKINSQYKKTGTVEIGILVRDCPVCGIRFNTMEQRKIYCSGSCRTKSCRAKSTC